MAAQARMDALPVCRSTPSAALARDGTAPVRNQSGGAGSSPGRSPADADDADAADVDEPSSTTQPVSTSFDTGHQGALVGADWDCWSFQVEEHEVMTLIIDWQAVPIELEQPHDVPTLVTKAGRLSPQPEVVTELIDEDLRIIYRWRNLATGEYDMCLRGSSDRFQEYSWAGLFGYEGSGPSDSTGFSSKTYYQQGTVYLGDESDAYPLKEQGVSVLILSIVN